MDGPGRVSCASMDRRLALLLAFALALAVPARPDPSVDPAIRALRRDSSLKVRTQAAIVLGQRGSAEAVPALREAVADDGSAAVRIAAVGALAKIGSPAARPTLRIASETDPDGAVRRAAARALQDLGPAALTIEEPSGTSSARGTVKESLARHLRDRGFAVAERGELRLKPTVSVEVAERGGKIVIAVKTSLVVVDGDGRMEMMESSARASVIGPVAEAKLAGYSAKVVDAAVRGLSEDLAARLGVR